MIANNSVGLWSLPHHTADEPRFGDSAYYDTITMPIGSEAFPNEDLSVDQSHSMHPTYSQILSKSGPTPSPNTKSDRMESTTLITFSAESSESNDGASSEAIYSNIQRLSKLQQDLFIHRTRMSDSAAEGWLGEVVDIDAVIGVGQAILELTRSLFTCFTTLKPLVGNVVVGRSDGRDDPARILLALTPSLLVVTTYNDILDLVSTALQEMKHFNSTRNMQISGTGFLAQSMANESAQRPQRGQPRHNAGLYGMTLNIGILDLGFPMRLVVSMSVIEYQLGPLCRCLQLIRSKYFQSQGIDTSRDMLTPSIEGLWSTSKALLERVGKLIEQAKLLDKH
jgi:hypothetical protein